MIKTDLGCGYDKTAYAGKAKYCRERGLDYQIYRLGAGRIKRMVQRRYGIVLNVSGKSLDEVTRDAMEVLYN